MEFTMQLEKMKRQSETNFAHEPVSSRAKRKKRKQI